VSAAAPAVGLLRTGSSAGRFVVAATVAGSSVAMITGTVVNVALPDIAAGLSTGTLGAQWIVNSYMLVLASGILIGGALGDRFGRRRVYLLGTTVFAVASVVAAAAPTLPVLLAARALMGVGGALLTPGSLAILEASFHPDDRSAAIGAWAGLGGVAAALGPLVGGLLLDAAGWRVLFLVNLPVCLLAVALTLRHVPESRDLEADGHRLDVVGTVTGAVGLAGLTYGLIALGDGLDGIVVASLAVGLVGLAAFVAAERRVVAPLMPLSMFADRVFSVANVITFVVYAALGGVFFLLVVFLRQVLGFTGLQAGAATMPIMVLMLLFSATSGRLANRVGPRPQLVVGPLLLAVGTVGFSRLGASSTYAADVLPWVLVFGVGLVTLVAPVTATVLAAADERRAGVASGINNAVARTAGLLAVAVLPAAAGLGPEAFADPGRLSAGFGTAMLVSAGLALVGAVVAGLGLPASVRCGADRDEPELYEQPHAWVECPPGCRHDHEQAPGEPATLSAPRS
jgi:EmrB/QacA subfamily drug resistance transporter